MRNQNTASADISIHTRRPVCDLLRSAAVKLSDQLDKLCCLAYVLAMLSFAAVLGLGVVFRYVLNDSLAWTDEAALTSFVWVTFLGAASGFLHDRHISVTMLRDALPRVWRTRALVAADGITLAYLLVITLSSLEGLDLVQRTHTDALQMPMTVPYLAIPTAGILMMAHWVRRVALGHTRPEGITALLVGTVLFAVLYTQVGVFVTLDGRSRLELLTVVFLIPLLLGVPVAFVLGLVASAYLAIIGTINFNTGALQTFYGISVISYLAIPLLILSGNAMQQIGVAKHLADFAQALVGWIKGGLGLADVLASVIFADISGSAVSDTAAIGSVMIPELKRQGYQPAFAAALQGAAGTLGLMFPPAISLLLYATVLNLSVSHLFAASILPGLLVATSFGVVIVLHARKHRYPTARTPRARLARDLRNGIPGLLACVFVVGGITAGIVTPAEIGVLVLAYVGILALTVYRGASPSTLYRAAIEAGHTSSMVLFLAATSMFLGFVLARESVPELISESVMSLSTNKYVVLMILNVLFIAAGMLLEAPAIIVAFLPSITPLIAKVGIDPIQWGVIFVVNAGIGLIHPPIGLTLSISSAIAGVSYERATIAALPFMGIMLVDLVLLSVFPQISLFLPSLLGH